MSAENKVKSINLKLGGKKILQMLVNVSRKVLLIISKTSSSLSD